jgi:uncharacterized DUF497 family protein
MPINLIVSPAIKDKLDTKHAVKVGEVHECFLNREGPYLSDDDEDTTQPDSPSFWFIAPTNKGRLLKVIFVQRDGNLYLKSAYEANAKSQQIYSQFSNNQE